ncbi:MAG TPA: hypothetical protein VNF92_13105 [Gemmatimonadaceae bacterium]|nr:hypothetical protein [Gemmatimonadaceae bacterium]
MIMMALCVAAPLAAQQASPGASAPQAATSVVKSAPAPAAQRVSHPGPMLERSAAEFRPHTIQPAPAPLLLPAYHDNSENVALMVVGGAGLIVGAVIGGRPGTIVMLGSGVIGLIGLYRYMQ